MNPRVVLIMAVIMSVSSLFVVGLIFHVSNI